MTLLRKITRRSTNAAISRFVKDTGLVHFGFVDQRSDDHVMIRGVTVSNNHRDEHYAVGTYEGYDVLFVERHDKLLSPKKHDSESHTWHIVQVDLKSKVDLPHVFLGLHTHSDAFYMQLFHKYPRLRQHRPGITANYDLGFLAAWRWYVSPTNALKSEQLLTPAVMKQFESHFGSLAVEIETGALYVYSEIPHITSTSLKAMLQNAVWLAMQIDAAHLETSDV